MFHFALNEDGTVSVYAADRGYLIDTFRMPSQCKSMDDFREVFWNPNYNLGKHKVVIKSALNTR